MITILNKKLLLCICLLNLLDSRPSNLNQFFNKHKKTVITSAAGASLFGLSILAYIKRDLIKKTFKTLFSSQAKDELKKDADKIDPIKIDKEKITIKEFNYETHFKELRSIITKNEKLLFSGFSSKKELEKYINGMFKNGLSKPNDKNSEKLITLVAMNENEVTGFVSFHLRSQNNDIENNINLCCLNPDFFGYILLLCVAKKFRGNGIATLLMNQAESKLKEIITIPKIALLSDTKENKDAVKLYKKLGFVQGEKSFSGYPNMFYFIKKLDDLKKKN